MRKLLIVVVAAAVALAALAVISQAGTGAGGTSWTYKFTNSKAGKPTGTESLIQPAIKHADGSYASTTKTTIIFQPGTYFDDSVPPRCKASGKELTLTNGAACSKAQIGKGDALSDVSGATFAAVLKAYNKKGGIWFLVTTCAAKTGPGQANPKCEPFEGSTFVLLGKLKYTDKAKTKPILVVPTPSFLTDQHVKITKFHLITDKVTKRKNINGKRVLVSYTWTPKKCKGKWNTKAHIDYESDPSQTLSSTQICKK